MELDDAFLKWEFALLARAETAWAIASLPLIRAADSLWARAEAYRNLWAEAFAEMPTGGLNTERRLTPAELEIFQDQGLDRVALMLLGLAIENVSKTILISAHADLVTDEGRFGLKSHNLSDLLRRCGVELTEEEVRQLAILRDYVQWLGRYPVPLSAVGKGSPSSVPGAWVTQRLGDPRTTWTVARSLLQRVVDERDQSMFTEPLSNER